MNSDSYTLSEAFAHYIITQESKGAKETVAEFLKANDLSKIALKRVVKQLGGSLSSFKDDLVDLLIFYIEFCLRDHHLSSTEKLSIRHLKILFGIKETDLYSLKGEKVKELIVIEIKRLLSHQKVDQVKSLYQVDLQEVFGLSYDRFLELTKEPIEEVVNDWIHKIASDGSVSEQERDFLYRQILTLDRVYRFTKYQKNIIENRQRIEFQAEPDTKSSNRQEKSRPIYEPKLHTAHTILGVEVGASIEEIRIAYKRMAQLHHPDKVAQMAPEIREVAEARMKDINVAYATLTEKTN
jgi:DnaJ-domain-containing protein 1